MKEKKRTEGSISSKNIKDNLLSFFDVQESEQATFLLHVDWILENAVYPKENAYVDNVVDLWNVYMPGWAFDKIILEYSSKFYSILRYVHDNELYRFNSEKLLLEAAIKNYLKYRASQGITNRMELVQDCFTKFQNLCDRNKLYDFVSRILKNYLDGDNINQTSVRFLKRFQDYQEQPYLEIVERLTEIRNQKNKETKSRTELFLSLNTIISEEQFQTLLNIILCKIATSDGERRFSDVLKTVWKEINIDIPYQDVIYDYIEKYEKPYMIAACFGILNIRDNAVIRKLYKDAVILCAVLEAVEQGNRYGIREINEYWRREGMIFAKGYYFEDEYERMKKGFLPDILIAYKTDIELFHQTLLKKIEASDLGNRKPRTEIKKRVSAEMKTFSLNEEKRKNVDLQDKINVLEEKIDNCEKDVYAQLISLLDSRKYNYVLGKLYRMAYSDDEICIEDVIPILKNFFEILNISGIDIFGRLGKDINIDDIKQGKYRVDGTISDKGKLKYPGYKIGNAIILHPVAEEG